MRVATMAAFLCVPVLILVAAAGQVARPVVEVYKSPTCGCCVNWVAHLRQHGLVVRTTDLPDLTDIKARHNVPGRLASCHTALVGGYVVEGHVPAEDVLRLLKERPPISGLAVPGMPVGSPGMEGPNPDAYNVLTFDNAGKIQIFSSHRP